MQHAQSPPGRFGATGTLPVSLLADADFWLSRVNLDLSMSDRRSVGRDGLGDDGEKTLGATEKAIHFG